MIKWYDELEKQIKEIQDEVDGIEAGEVDAKNLSEVLDKDAPVTLTTDLQNNKVKVGLNIDDSTLEIEEGKLKVKGGGSGGTKKYLHKMQFQASDKTNNTIVVKGYFEFITEDATPYNNYSTFSATTKEFVNNKLVPALFGKQFADIPVGATCAITGHLYKHATSTKALEPYALFMSSGHLEIGAEGIYINNGELIATFETVDFNSNTNDILMTLTGDIVTEL